MEKYVYLAIAAIATFILYRLSRGAIYVPTDENALRQVAALAKIKPGEKAVDLGAGDGRIVIALAKAGAEAHGYEHNPLLVWIARRRIRKAGLSGRAFVHRKNFWDESLAAFDVIVIFGVGYIMRRLEKKLSGEAKRNARIISHVFKFPDWAPQESKEGVHLYNKQALQE